MGLSVLFHILMVSIASSQSIKVRLVREENAPEGGDDNPLKEGRIEIIHNGEWGTVCDDRWDDVDATVVCRQLELGVIGEAVGGARFGEGSGTIWLDEVSCRGSEDELTECDNSGWDNSDCQHREDAGVRCRDTVPVVRLVNGANETEGRVEVFYDGVWGTVCDDYWDDIDATVVCRELGLGTSGEAIRRAAFGEGIDPIWLDNVGCTGCDDHIHSCRSKDWGSVRGCDHDEDAGVRCGNFVRLAVGGRANEGRVEVFHDGEWGTMGDGGWDDADATVVCRQLGLPTPGRAISDAQFGEGSGSVWLDDIACLGYEESLYLCRKSDWGPHGGGSEPRKDAGVRCIGDDQMEFLDDVDGDSREGQNQDAKQGSPVLYVIIAILTVVVFALVVYIIILRHGENTNSAPDRIKSFIPNRVLEKIGKKSCPDSHDNAENASPDDRDEVYNTAYESRGNVGATDEQGGDGRRSELGTSVPGETAGHGISARSDNPEHEYAAIPDQKAEAGSGEHVDYQYVKY